MKKILIFSFSLMLVSPVLFAQKFITKNGYIRFFSHSSMEDIDAKNNQVNSALDISTGDFVFKALMKSFEFSKALMQEHFNENYVESDKFPNASFKGKIINIFEINFTKSGTYNANVEGDLTIHGITKHIKEKGTFQVIDNNKITGNSKFIISLKEYNVIIPKTVVNNISDNIEITVEVSLMKLNK